MKAKPLNKTQRTMHRQALNAMQEAVAQVIEDHRRLNLPLALWENGKVKMVPARQLRKRKIVA